MSAGDFSRYDNMKMLLHHIYEFRKGVRDLVLCTLCPTCAGLLIERLRSQGIDYLLQPVTEQKVNLSASVAAWTPCRRSSINR